MGALDNRELAYERMIQLWRIHVSRPTKDILAQGGLEETFNTLAG